jgi:hypothetical protein
MASTSPPASPPPSQENYKVEYEIPPTDKKTKEQIKSYMTTPENEAIYAELTEKDKIQVINNDLLQIISRGIDQIVFDLKTKLGNNFEESNDKALEISTFLDELKNRIDIETMQIGKDNTGNVIDALQITKDANDSYISNPDNHKDPFYRQSDINPQISYDNIKLDHDVNTPNDFKNLDNPYISVLPNGVQDSIAKRQTTDVNEINTRLLNCQNLEFLYLKKHDEIMKIFAFTINLFDKYKYAIKVILFLLKNLVYKDPDTDTTPTIDLPLPIISNIKKLVEDQNRVQGIIDDMKNSLDEDGKNFKDDKLHTYETLINSKKKTPKANPP